MTRFINLKNQSHRFMTIFSNFINQSVTSHSKIKKLRYFRLTSSALARNTTHKAMDKRRLKIISRVLEEIKLNFPETIQITEDCL